ncbi:MAG: hypothetical protein L0241_08140 [Planctomycetia bacterium]|nr:hypothetical protein [Planctomycetia bacterium]
MFGDESATTLELPVIGKEDTDTSVNHDQEFTDNFLEPLIFQWSEDDYAASQAVRLFCDELYSARTPSPISNSEWHLMRLS